MFEKYIIKNGENLNTISSRFNTTPEYIMNINNIYYEDYLRAGNELIVPKTGQDYYDYYTVEKGDTLYSISKKYNINPELLANINGLEMEDYIYTGQDILIPKSGYSYYITKEGDTLDTVSNLFGSNNSVLENNEVIYLLAGQLLVNKN